MVAVKVEGIPALRVLTQTAFDRKLADINESREATPAERDRARGILYGASIESKVRFTHEGDCDGGKRTDTHGVHDPSDAPTRRLY